MAYPQLTGGIGRALAPSTGRSVLIAIGGLASVLAVSVWRFLPAAPPADGVALVAPAAAASPPLPSAGPSDRTDDRQLHLERAEESLLAAGEQLSVARRTLTTLISDLNRNYLQSERRESVNAWTSCEAATRALERARDDIKAAQSTRKD